MCVDDFSDDVPAPSTPSQGMCGPGMMRGNPDMQKMQMMQMMQMKSNGPAQMGMGMGMQGQMNPQQKMAMMQQQQQQQQQQMMMMQNMQRQQQQQAPMLMRQPSQQMMMMQGVQRAMPQMQMPIQVQSPRAAGIGGAGAGGAKAADKGFPQVTSEKVRHVKYVPGTEAMLFYCVGGVSNTIKINRSRPVITMGKHTEVDIRLDARELSISRFHATVMCVISEDETSAKFIFKDTSQYGSFVNNEKTSECELRDGSRIRLGTSPDFIYFVGKKKLLLEAKFIIFIMFIIFI